MSRICVSPIADTCEADVHRGSDDASPGDLMSSSARKSFQNATLFFASLLSFTAVISLRAVGVLPSGSLNTSRIRRSAGLGLPSSIAATNMIKKVGKQTTDWPLATMGVIHLRYDVGKCGKGGPPPHLDPERNMCIVKPYRANIRSMNPVKWLDTFAYISNLHPVMAANGVKTIYLSKSPEFPEFVYLYLRKMMQTIGTLRVEQPASVNFTGKALELMEWKLARESHFFLGDVHSAWSNSVVTARNNVSSYAYVNDVFCN
jgi:hypothetical protein